MALDIDPPHTGCDGGLMAVWQLLAFPAQTMDYASCNVHMQASDVEQIVLVC
jgi:tRNA/tmRNA/rRNA uracil-C5-methylase (TrmA/RlmC/RlmD family)